MNPAILLTIRRERHARRRDHDWPAHVHRVSSVIVGIVLLSIAAGCSRTDKQSHSDDPKNATVVVVTPVTRRNMDNKLAIAAEFHPFQEIDVDAKVAGYVKSILVDVGDHVHQGQILAILEIPELEDQIRQDQAVVAMAQQGINQARAEVQRDESAYTAAHLQYMRLAGVMKTQPDLVAQQDVDNAQAKDQGADAEVAASKANQGAAESRLSVAKANEEKTATLFAYARIIAPFTGVITRRYADTGAMLPAGTSSSKQELPLVRLSQNDLLRLEIPVPEEDVPKVQLNTPVDVYVKALQEHFQGKVARFADSLDMSTRSMLTEVDVPNPEYKLVPGMYADVSVTLDRRAGATAAPIQALYAEGDTFVAFVVNGLNRVEKRPLTIGIRTGDAAEILTGLQAGERVAISHLDQLHNGELVQPRTVEDREMGESQ